LPGAQLSKTEKIPLVQVQKASETNLAMAHLISNHDPYHVHKILGLFALVHFLYRLFNIAINGYAFSEWELQEGSSWPLACLLLHGLLSWSSLLLPLTKKRILTAPMIWPEFRLHSIAFATRHVLGTGMCIAGLWSLGSPEQQLTLQEAASSSTLPFALAQRLYTFAVRSAIVLATSHAAAHITEHMGSKADRTTNSMPYPPGTSAALGQQFKAFYATAQFHATAQAVAGDATMAFAPLFAIQGAPLLMTLVRKGKLGATAYHITYTLALLVPYLALLSRLLLHPEQNALPWLVRAVAGRLAIELRIMRHYPRPVAWIGSMVALSLFEVMLELSGASLSGPMVVLALGTWSVRVQIKNAMSHPTAADCAAASLGEEEGDIAPPVKNGHSPGVESRHPVPGDRASPAAAALSASFAHGTAASNPFHMLGAMRTLWALEVAHVQHAKQQ
jgi:hypothetical protein